MPSTRESRVLTSEAAHAAVEAAVAEGRELGAKVNCAVVDAGGNLLAFLREPGAFLHSIQFAIDKAYTSASFGAPTEEMYDAVAEPPRLRENIVAQPRFITFGGGLPIESDGHRVGGIGVSGGSEEQDMLCAQAGLDAIAEGH